MKIVVTLEPQEIEDGLKAMVLEKFPEYGAMNFKMLRKIHKSSFELSDEEKRPSPRKIGPQGPNKPKGPKPKLK